MCRLVVGLSCWLGVSPLTLANEPPIPSASPEIRITRNPGLMDAPLSGRLVIMFGSPDVASGRDLRLDLSPAADALAFFGQDVSNWRVQDTLTLSPESLGFPYGKLAELPAGRYRIQASFERYESYSRSDGHRLQLPVIEPLDSSLAAQTSPRRWYSAAEDITWDHRQSPRPLTLTTPVPHTAAFTDTPWVKSLRIRSERLSLFWGRDIFLGAFVTLPAGYADHPSTRYPWIIRLGGLPLRPTHRREQPPAADLSVTSAAWRWQQAGWENFQYWQSPETPRMILVELQHPTPYADSSLVVDSLNNGPYAEAIRHELLPAIEHHFRVESAGWARFLSGSAEGGWSVLALQIRHPDDFNGAWAVCPDPIDLRYFGLVNLQDDRNAFFDQGMHWRVARAARRDARGQALAQLTDIARWEQALADRSRSGELWDRWDAAFSPVDATGYPQRIWQRQSGEIDDRAAEHWHHHYDLHGLLQRQSADRLAVLRGKVRIRIGDRDEYFFDNAIRAFEAHWRVAAPELELSVDYGRGISDCWSGRHDLPPEEARLRHLQDVIPWAFERLQRTAPATVDLSRWRY